MLLTMSASNATCGFANGSASVVVSGHTPPPSYNWSNGPITSVITVAAGTYTVTVTDGAGCTASNSVTVNDAGVPFTLTTSVNNNVTCNGQCKVLPQQPPLELVLSVIYGIMDRLLPPPLDLCWTSFSYSYNGWLFACWKCKYFTTNRTNS
jgi:hypothetical protein